MREIEATVNKGLLQRVPRDKEERGGGGRLHWDAQTVVAFPALPPAVCDR